MKKIITIFLILFSFSFSNENKNLKLRLKENPIEAMFHTSVTHFIIGVNFNNIVVLTTAKSEFELLKDTVKTNNIHNKVNWDTLGLTKSPFSNWKTLDKWIEACNIHIKKADINNLYTPDSVVCFGNANDDFTMLENLGKVNDEFAKRLQLIANNEIYKEEALELEKALTGNAQLEKLILQHLITYHLSNGSMPIDGLSSMCDFYQHSSKFADLGFRKALSIINSEDFYLKYGE